MNAWFTRVYTDDRLHASHIALYLALFQFWNLNRFQNPILIFREELMRLSKIGSANTYTRCIKELDQWGYIRYKPSFNPMKGSRVELYSFSKSDDTADDNSTDNAVDEAGRKADERVLRPVKKQGKQLKHKNSHIDQNKNFDESL